MFSSPFKKRRARENKQQQRRITTTADNNEIKSGSKRKTDIKPSTDTPPHSPKHPRRQQDPNDKNNSNMPTSSEAKNGGGDAGIDFDATIAMYQSTIAQEKAGKRKLFHSLVKLATELKRVRSDAVPLQENAEYANKAWYEGGLWRSPRVLPGVQHQRGTRARLREAISLSDLFFNLVIVTAFTRVGVAIAQDAGMGSSVGLTPSTFLYFAVFWSVWSKEASYSTRFDTTDLSAQLETLVTCFAVLFASLSVSAPLNSPGGTRIMIMAAFCALLHFGLYVRVYSWNWRARPDGEDGSSPADVETPASDQGQPPSLQNHVHRYAAFNMTMNFLEALNWILGLIFLPETSSFRWIVFVVGVLLALRIPRAFMANDFHAACTKRGVIFILLLGFMLQSLVVVATDFFQYDSPTIEQYSFIGAACLMLFCIKLLYVDDSATLASDHALLVNRTAAMCFNLGQFVLLLSTTVMGSGLTLLTHSYLAAAAALPDHAKNLVCGGYATTILSTMFIKSMHLKRVPIDPYQRRLFVGAYLVQAITTLVIVGVTMAMSLGHGGYLQVLMQQDVELLWLLSGFALLLAIVGWLDEGLELVLFGGKMSDDSTNSQSEDYLVHPFGFWWCLYSDVSMDELDEGPDQSEDQMRRGSRGSYPRLSVLSPLLGESIANMKDSFRYDAMAPTKESADSY